MQLEAPSRPSALRSRLSAVACLLLASGMPAAAHAQTGATSQFDGSVLIYGEKSRAQVFEPTARVTRLYPDGQSLSAQLGIDVITGASPSGAMPSGRIQTTTTPSGHVTRLPAGQIPLSSFKDIRGALDLEWQKPFWGRLTSTTGAHASREKDYQSLGANAKLTADLMQRLTTLTVGAGFNRDGVFPVGGTPVGLSDGSILLGTGSNPKRVASAMAGVSRILTRRWMMAVNASRAFERGYLTEPYKVVSLLDANSGVTVGQLTEQRPATRDRADVLVSSIYHLTQDVLYLSYRYYWDDWGVRSNTVDLKYRRELQDHTFLQPHLRFYRQSAADFFTFGLIQGAAVPDIATSDFRLGPLRTMTLGATYGFHLADYPGEFSVRAEYMRQWGNGHPPDAVGVQRDIDLFPALDIGSLIVGYSVQF
jgi:hypothetical protein